MIQNPYSLSGKLFIISGASSGIGRQCAIRCSELGARIILLGRDEARLDETLSMMDGDDHVSHSIDLLDYVEVEKIVNGLAKSVGRFDGIINSAGISTTRPLSSSKPEILESFLATNVCSGMNLTRIASKKSNFSLDGGSIIFISSVMGSVGEKGKSIYSITKGAIDSGVRSLALELAIRRIRVNSISPGVVITPLSKKAVYSSDEESLARVSDLHPLGLGEPDDVAYSASFLLSDTAKWITGINLVVDGGYICR